jgi:molecular chaperone IbpA
MSIRHGHAQDGVSGIAQPGQFGGRNDPHCSKENVVMDGFDFTPLFRSTIGFDRLMRLADSATRLESGTSYPPYDIEVTGENAYRLTMAVSGFGPEDLDITVKEDALLVSGRSTKEEQAKYLHHGLARRAFERRFQLAEHIKVTGAALENGLLHVELTREVPEASKPRKIEIATRGVIEQKAA